MIDKIVTHCNTSELYKKTLYHNQPQDLVKAKNFNHTVSMDLGNLEKNYGIYISLMSFQDLVMPQ